MTANTQQLLDILIVAIMEKSTDADLITVEEIGDIVRYFSDAVYDQIDGDEIDEANDGLDDDDDDVV